MEMILYLRITKSKRQSFNG